MLNKKIYFFIGTNAEFIKLAPVIKNLKKRKIKFKIITSGQSEIHFDEIKGLTGPMKANFAIRVKTHGLSIPHFLIWMIRTFFVSIRLLKKEFENLDASNSYFIVHGDTASSLMGAFIAKIYGLRLVHVESGLRSFNFLEPIPEEINRFIISFLADIRFCQNKFALKNVLNYRGENINTYENTLIESFHWAINTPAKTDIISKDKKYFVLYIRRQEHIFFQKKWVNDVLEEVTKSVNPNLNCVFLLHPLASIYLSPERVNSLYEQLGKRFFMISRMPYAQFMKLLNKSEFAVTDGCTNQEEAYYMGLPLLSLRNRSERMEGLGKNVILFKDKKRIMKNFLKNYKKYKRKPVEINKPPSQIIVDYLLNN